MMRGRSYDNIKINLKNRLTKYKMGQLAYNKLQWCLNVNMVSELYVPQIEFFRKKKRMLIAHKNSAI